MKNYYEFNNLYDDGESIKFYKSMPKQNLILLLNDNFDNINYYLKYYAKFFKSHFGGNDYDEHYYNFLTLLESINDIQIILNILKDSDNYEK